MPNYHPAIQKLAKLVDDAYNDNRFLLETCGDRELLKECGMPLGCAVSTIVQHWKFGRGVVKRIDRETYSIPFAVVEFEAGLIARPLHELDSV